MKRNIRINTPLGPQALLFQQMTGHEALSTPFEYKVQLLSPKSDLDLSALLGQLATIEVDMRAGGTRYFNGYVTSFSYVGSYQGSEVAPLGRYEMTLRPWLWLLTLSTNCRIFQKETTTDIVKNIWRQHGFSNFREALTRTTRTWDYSVQYRETDFNYTTRLLEQEGIYYYFEHENGKHTLVLADAPSAHKPMPGYADVPFFAGSSGARRDHLSTWAVGRQMRPGAFATTDYDFTNPRADLSAKLEKPASHKLAAFEVYDYPGEYLTGQEGEVHARIRLEEHQADHHVVTTTGNAMGLSPGGKFALSGHPRPDQNKEHLIVSASYELSSAAYHSGNDDESEFEGSYTMIPADVQYRPPTVTPKPRVDGPQTARVVGRKGEDIWHDKHNRIKVQFHWDREGKKDENSSCWVRVAQQWAGSGFGFCFIPRIGQEVVVDFLEGDPDQPLIVGRVYNQDNMPPYSKTQSGIKTRSTKGGGVDNYNEIRFEDLKGSEEIFIQAEKNHVIVVKNDESHKIGNDRTKEIKNDETVTIGNNRKEKVGADETIEVLGQRTRKVTKDETVTVTGNRTVTIKSAESRTVTKSRTTEIGADDGIHVKGNRNLVIDGNDSIKVSKKRDVRVTGTRTTKIDDNDNLRAKNVTIEADQQITLKTGSASLTMKSDGTIVLKGNAITIQGKDIVAKGSKVKLQ
jgi:type VI secretion system secreted protein VgrG